MGDYAGSRKGGAGADLEKGEQQRVDYVAVERECLFGGSGKRSMREAEAECWLAFVYG